MTKPPTIDVVRCEHPHDTGAAHPLDPECVYPHFVGKAAGATLPREDVEKIRGHLKALRHSGLSLGTPAYADLDGLLRRLP